jgi:hypothetical protein
MDIVLGFVFLLCLLLLVMIFGEQLSVLGAFHGRWLSALTESIADLWDFLCEEIDRGWRFVLEHLWWVLAVGSGGSGVVLVAWMMFGGIADQAAADLSGRTGQLHAGGILDHVPEIVPPRDLDQALIARSEDLINPRIDQVSARVGSGWNPGWDSNPDPAPGRNGMAVDDFPPLFRGRTHNSPDALEEPRLRDWETLPVGRGSLPFESENRPGGRRRTPSFSRWTEEYLPDDDQIIRISGRAINSITLKSEIAAALERLDLRRRDDWRRSERFRDTLMDFSDTASDIPRVPEATRDELDLIKSSVRVVPGSSVGDSDLYIEKRIVPAQQRNEFEIEISVTNQSPRRMSGLLVHEHLGSSVEPVFIDDGGVFRDSRVTWVIDDLRPLKTQTIRLQVRSDSAGTISTRTVISAVAAVTSEVVVESDRRTRFTPGRSDVQLTIGKVPRTATVSEKLEISFRLKNVGTGPATEVVLRIDLPAGLDHFHLEKDDVDRTVDVTIRDLEPNTSRVKVLRLTAVEPGQQTAVVELLENRKQTDLTTFDIRVLADDDTSNEATDQRPLLPRPDDAFPSDRR